MPDFRVKASEPLQPPPAVNKTRATRRKRAGSFMRSDQWMLLGFVKIKEAQGAGDRLGVGSSYYLHPFVAGH